MEEAGLISKGKTLTTKESQIIIKRKEKIALSLIEAQKACSLIIITT